MRTSGSLFPIKLRGTVLGTGGRRHLLRPLEHEGCRTSPLKSPKVSQTQNLLYLRHGLSLVLNRYRWGSAATVLMAVQWQAIPPFPKELLLFSPTLSLNNSQLPTAYSTAWAKWTGICSSVINFQPSILKYRGAANCSYWAQFLVPCVREGSVTCSLLQTGEQSWDVCYS